MSDRAQELLQGWYQRLQIRKRVKKLSVKIDRLLFLERLFLLAIALIMIYFVWYLVFMLPVQGTYKRLNTRIQSSERQLQMLERKAKTIVTQAVMKKQENKDQHRSLLGKIDKLDKEIDGFQKGFTTASTMAGTLREALDQQGKLKLQSLTTLPVRVIVKPENGEQKLTEQGITFAFRGKYFDTLDYLRRLEQLKTQLLWDKLRYNVLKYPEAGVTITLFLLNPLKDEEENA